MAKITDPDSLSVHVVGVTTSTTQEVVLNTATKTIQLRILGNLNDDSPGKESGVTAKALYSFLKEEWLNGAGGISAALRRFKFPLKMIFEGSFIFVNGWAPADDQTRDLIRDAGFQEQLSGDEYACFLSLGSMNNPAADLAYYTQAAGFTQTPVDFDKTGELNENVQIYESTGPVNYRGYFKAFLREQGKLYSEYNLLTEQGLSTLNYQAYSFPLSNSTDLKISASDATISTTAPYTGMKINYLKGSGFTTMATATTYAVGNVVRDSTNRWFFCTTGGTTTGTSVATGSGTAVFAPYEGERQIGTTWYAFNRIIKANGGTAQQVYEWMQWSLRQATDINANDPTLGDGSIPLSQLGFGTVNGNVALPLGVFVGDNLKPAGGVWLDGFNVNSTNNIQHSPIDINTGGLTSEFIPVSSTEVAFPFVSAGTFNFSANLVAQPDAQTYYTVYYDYIRRTTTSVTITPTTGSTATFAYSAGALDYLSFTAGGVSGTVPDYFSVTGATNAINNGLWRMASNPSANSFTATKVAGGTPISETTSLTVDENPFESPEAFIVNNNSGSPLSGQITAATIAFDFDYTNNQQGGRNPSSTGVAAPCRLVAQALNGAEWTEVAFTITNATGITVTVNANDERNYSNP